MAPSQRYAKMYATLLNSRLTKWAEANDLRAAGQAGFRQDHRCSDHLLVLRTVIEQQRIVKAPLYTCFVDFKKAYDTVPRDLLWTKLQRLGVHGWFLDGIKALYAEVLMAVKTAQGLTCTFDSVMGVKQGCPLSPTLFGLYLDDLEDAMSMMRRTWFSGARHSARRGGGIHSCSHRGRTAFAASWDRIQRQWRRSCTSATRRTRRREDEDLVSVCM